MVAALKVLRIARDGLERQKDKVADSWPTRKIDQIVFFDST